MRLLLAAFLAASASSVSLAQGQQPAGPVLTLEEAVQLALKNNPQHLRTRSNRARAGTNLKTSRAAILPSVSSSFGAQYREGRSEQFAGQTLGATSDQVGTNAGISVSMFLNGSTFMAPKESRANLDAAELDVAGSEQNVRATVIQDYLTVLQAQATAALQDTLLLNVQAQLELARARQQVGAATQLEVRNAEVQVGQQRVAVLRERNNLGTALLVLFQAMGIPEQDGARLTTTFAMAEPTLQLNELLDMARKGNPTLNAYRARENAASAGVSVARSQWLPSLSLSTGLSGYTSQQTNIEGQIAQARAQSAQSRSSCFTTDSLRRGAGLSGLSQCGSIEFTDAQANAIRSANSSFPLSFTRNALTYNAQLSFPIFDRFQREQRIQEAELSRNDARYSLREQQLRLTSDVTSAYRNLITQYQTVQFNVQNQQAAREALQLAQERYRVGATTFLDVTNAQTQLQTAATNYIISIYSFHKFFAALEAAVGRPLR